MERLRKRRKTVSHSVQRAAPQEQGATLARTKGRTEPVARATVSRGHLPSRRTSTRAQSGDGVAPASCSWTSPPALVPGETKKGCLSHVTVPRTARPPFPTLHHVSTGVMLGHEPGAGVSRLSIPFQLLTLQSDGRSC